MTATTTTCVNDAAITTTNNNNNTQSPTMATHAMTMTMTTPVPVPIPSADGNDATSHPLRTNILLSYLYCICSSKKKNLLIQWSECPQLGTLEQLGEWSGVELK